MPSLESELIKLPSALEDVRIKSLPANAFYIADFISPSEEAAILQKIANAPKPRWKVLTHRRLQTWPSDLTKSNSLFDSPLPTWLVEPVISRLLALPLAPHENALNIFSDSPHGIPNHVLINEYQPGQGIMPHMDGSAYYPVVCTVSLGASLCLDIYSASEEGIRDEKPRWKILQEPRSLLITTDDMYTKFLHGIGDIKTDVDLSPTTVANWSLLRSPEDLVDGKNDRETRTSLTYRDVLKVSKLGTKFGSLVNR